MRFTQTDVKGVLISDLEPVGDERGFFARAWCAREFAGQGVEVRFVQQNIAFTKRRGTLRGLHFQKGRHWEEKLVRCTRGSAYVVVADLRRESPSYGQWCAVELTAENHRQLYVPVGCAQGYQVLQDDTELFYQMSQYYTPESSLGFRFDDPAFGIDWPLAPLNLSERDRGWPDYEL